MMLSLIPEESRMATSKSKSKSAKTPTQIVSPRKAIGQEQCPCPIEASRFDD
jgi:hypothetical protein